MFHKSTNLCIALPLPFLILLFDHFFQQSIFIEFLFTSSILSKYVSNSIGHTIIYVPTHWRCDRRRGKWERRPIQPSCFRQRHRSATTSVHSYWKKNGAYWFCLTNFGWKWIYLNFKIIISMQLKLRYTLRTVVWGRHWSLTDWFWELQVVVLHSSFWLILLCFLE